MDQHTLNEKIAPRAPVMAMRSPTNSLGAQTYVNERIICG